MSDECPHGRPMGMFCKFGCQVRMALERERARPIEVVAPLAPMTEEEKAAYEKRKWTTRHRKNRYGR